MTTISNNVRATIKLLFIFFLFISFFSCTKDITVKTPPSDKIAEEIESKSNPGIFSILDGYPSGDYYSHFEDLFNGNYGVYIFPATGLHHIYKWELLQNGVVIASDNNADYYDQSGQYHYLTTLSSPSSGTYIINVWFNATWNGSQWIGWSPLPGDPPLVSSESVLQTDNTGSVQIHRYYSPSIKDHFYTKTKTFYKMYNYENVEWTAWTAGQAGILPFYRYWSASSTDHFYTTTSGSYSGYALETVEGYVATSGTKPIYRYYSSSDKDHFYTLTGGTYSGYVYEGIAGYAQ